MSKKILFDTLYLDMNQNQREALTPGQLKEYEDALGERKAEIVRVFDNGIAEVSARLERNEKDLNDQWRSVAHGAGINLNAFRQRGLDRIADEKFLLFLKEEKARLFE